MVVRACPKCGSVNVHRSRRRHFPEHLLALVLLRPYRCFDCKTRYFGWRFGKSMAPPDAKHPRRKRNQSEETAE